MLDLNNNYINEYKSILDAERDRNIHSSNISKVCKGKRCSAGGYKWKYKI
jgi:ferredoxin